MASQFLTPKRIGKIVFAAALAIYFGAGARNLIGYYRQEYELPKFAEEMARTKLQATPLERQLRGENAFGHARDARVLACVFEPAPPYQPQRWDYICFLYWGTQPGVEQSINEMKFGAMVDSSHVTRMSALVPAKGPDPPLDAKPSAHR